ncbi:hypothetical protein GOD82_04165 [Sinorhizobium medicae]|nr:hypothetical protein [Sinorhizobium medicae]
MMRKPYSSPNYDDPVEYLTRPPYGHAAPKAKIAAQTSASVTLVIAITIDLEIVPHGSKSNSEDHNG